MSVARRAWPQICVVLTDGVSTDKKGTQEEAKLLREANVAVFAIGKCPVPPFPPRLSHCVVACVCACVRAYHAGTTSGSVYLPCLLTDAPLNRSYAAVPPDPRNQCDCLSRGLRRFLVTALLCRPRQRRQARGSRGDGEPKQK